MATKKEKRAAALAKREKFLAQYKADGLKAQGEDQENRKEQLRQAEERKESQQLNDEVGRLFRHSLATMFIRGLSAQD